MPKNRTLRVLAEMAKVEYSSAKLDRALCAQSAIRPETEAASKAAKNLTGEISGSCRSSTIYHQAMGTCRRCTGVRPSGANSAGARSRAERPLRLRQTRKIEDCKFTQQGQYLVEISPCLRNLNRSSTKSQPTSHLPKSNF